MFDRIRSRTEDDDPPPPPSASSAPGTPPRNNIPRRPIARSRESLRSPSVRIRRTPSSQSITSVASSQNNASSSNVAAAGGGGLQDIPEESATGRRRSSSEPQRPSWYSQPGAGDRLAKMSTNAMPSIAEGQQSASGRNRSSTVDDHLGPHFQPHGAAGVDAVDQYNSHVGPHGPGLEQPRPGRLRRMASGARNWVPGMGGSRTSQSDANSIDRRRQEEEDEYDSEMVDLLDVIGACALPTAFCCASDIIVLIFAMQILRSRRCLPLPMCRTPSSCRTSVALSIGGLRTIFHGGRRLQQSY